MSNAAKTMPDAFKNFVGCLVDKWVAGLSEMKQDNPHDLRALVSLNVTGCSMIKYMQLPTRFS